VPEAITDYYDCESDSDCTKYTTSSPKYLLSNDSCHPTEVIPVASCTETASYWYSVIQDNALCAAVTGTGDDF
jgi:hypothetical protein